MTTRLKGKSIQVKVDGKTIALSTSCSLSLTPQIDNTRTKDDATGPAGDLNYCDWSISADSIAGMNESDSAQMIYDTLFDLATQGVKPDIEFISVKDATGAIPVGDWQQDTAAKVVKGYHGTCIIDKLDITAPAEGDATVSVSFKGAGQLQRITAS